MKQYFSFQWHITDECDQRCKHCYIFSEDNCREKLMTGFGSQDLLTSRWKKSAVLTEPVSAV